MVSRLARTAKRALARVAGRKFVKHYVEPLRVRGAQAPYDAKRYFESWHRASGSLEDAETIAPGASPLRTAYHYNAVESAIIEALAGRALPSPLRVLDVGSGAGQRGGERVVVRRRERGGVDELDPHGRRSLRTP